MILDDILARINDIPEDQQAAIVALASQTMNKKFIPNPGPQP